MPHQFASIAFTDSVRDLQEALGSRQYISTGNFQKNDRVALILMDYPNRTRLKILGRVQTVTDDVELPSTHHTALHRAGHRKHSGTSAPRK